MQKNQKKRKIIFSIDWKIKISKTEEPASKFGDQTRNLHRMLYNLETYIPQFCPYFCVRNEPEKYQKTPFRLVCRPYAKNQYVTRKIAPRIQNECKKGLIKLARVLQHCLFSDKLRYYSIFMYVSIERTHFIGKELRGGYYTRQNYLLNETLTSSIALKKDIFSDF